MRRVIILSGLLIVTLSFSAYVANEPAANIPGSQELEQFEADYLANKQVQILVTDWCPYCKKLEAYLNDKKVRYTRFDVEKDKKGKQLYEQLGRGGVPIVMIGKDIIRGFNTVEIEQALTSKSRHGMT